MFGSLKKKFNNALQESARLSETLHEQYRQRVSKNSTPNTPTSPVLSDSGISSGNNNQSLGELDLPSNINIAAGCNLLAKYESGWEAIHAANEANAQSAEILATQIENIERRLAGQRTAMTDLIGCLAGIPALVQKLQASVQALQEITQLNDEAEKRLEELEDLCEECDLQELMLQKHCELSTHKQMKMAELESYRQRVAAEHQQKIRKHEQHLRNMQRERQAVFDDAFRSDLAEYKQKGMLPKIEKQSSKEVPLEEVVLEDNETKDALEDFLNA